MFAIAAETVTKWGMYVLLPVFIAFLFFIMWDIAKKSDAGKAGTFWIFVALGAGFVGFLLKVVLEFVFEKWIL
ncbi:DUF2788 domain-containing protein [Psychrobacter sp. I-STPA6b]|uniref:DUF2788 domain-containing protein n=1 Tax=Psychrobacter sp. I-STPA6b TaxID=2585718 RepID=UPI001D0C25B3|nr:DUF2788 domain-containing protein [Psychrobacter sp. I-STPA6b]